MVIAQYKYNFRLKTNLIIALLGIFAYWFSYSESNVVAKCVILGFAPRGEGHLRSSEILPNVNW